MILPPLFTVKACLLSISILSAFKAILEPSLFAFVKIDVEGFELNVVLGMQNFLKKLHPVVFIEIRGCFYNQINDIFTALGYKGELVEDMYGLDCANYIYY